MLGVQKATRPTLCRAMGKSKIVRNIKSKNMRAEKRVIQKGGDMHGKISQRNEIAPICPLGFSNRGQRVKANRSSSEDGVGKLVLEEVRQAHGSHLLHESREQAMLEKNGKRGTARAGNRGLQKKKKR